MLAGQVIIGSSQSLTVTWKLHCLWLPTPSVAVQLTVVVPNAKLEPDNGLQVTVGACPAEQFAALTP